MKVEGAAVGVAEVVGMEGRLESAIKRLNLHWGIINIKIMHLIIMVRRTTL